MWQEFKLTYYNVVVQYVSHYAMATPTLYKSGQVSVNFENNYEVILSIFFNSIFCEAHDYASAAPSTLNNPNSFS